jgi:hypothetical protein
MVVNDELEMMLQEAVVVYFNVEFQHLSLNPRRAIILQTEYINFKMARKNCKHFKTASNNIRVNT